MGKLAQQLHCAMPRLSSAGREIVVLLADSGGRIPSADCLAMGIGLSSRHQLTRTLRREGLPQIEELCAWIKALHLLLEWEATRRSLYALALNEALYPPNCYRLIKRVTGKTWRQACADGFGVMLVRFVNRCLIVNDRRKAEVSKAAGQIA